MSVSVFTEEDTTSLPSLDNQPPVGINPLVINSEGVIKLLKDLHQHKASDPDDIATSKIPK